MGNDYNPRTAYWLTSKERPVYRTRKRLQNLLQVLTNTTARTCPGTIEAWPIHDAHSYVLRWHTKRGRKPGRSIYLAMTEYVASVELERVVADSGYTRINWTALVLPAITHG